ncbi:MAG: hypothetical protein DRR19_06990 [Candidatus Parabeggiatoa sp. nov. 1]|nr:MAG: hypothetical protein DRR19_06990 [Gammaproteobacteria bacterium]
MAKTKEEFPPIIGLELVGRGLNLRPHQAYEIKEIIFKRKPCGPTLFKQNPCSTSHSLETGQTYWVPDGYEVNESPPMPANQATNQIIIEESWEHFDKRFNVDTNVAASTEVFSVDVQASQTSQLRSSAESFYAVRTSFIPFWTLYIPNVVEFVDKEKFNLDIPTPFEHKYREEYEKFFERYGTHYIRRAWVGGKAMLTFTVAKSAQMSKEEIRRGISASNMIASGSQENTQQESKEKLQQNSECTVSGQGGEQSKLGALSSLDETSYNEWLATVKKNPKVIEMEAVGIWTILPNRKKAQALLEAYKAATTFTPISSILKYDRKVYFLRADKYTCYDIEKGETKKPKPISDIWPSLSKVDGFEKIDAAFKGHGVSSLTGEDLSRKLFFFKNNRYLRLDANTGDIDDGYPKLLSQGWPGVTFERIDAAFVWSNTVYFFKGNKYIRCTLGAEKPVDSGYPQLISERWSGITFERIDAAIALDDGKTYFFKGDEYIRYDMVEYRASPGYPKFIVGNYVEDWKFFG